MAEMLTLAEAGDRLGLSAHTLRHQVAYGRLKATKVGKTWVTTPAEVERYRRESLGKRADQRFARARARVTPDTPCAGCGEAMPEEWHDGHFEGVLNNGLRPFHHGCEDF